MPPTTRSRQAAAVTAQAASTEPIKDCSNDPLVAPKTDSLGLPGPLPDVTKRRRRLNARPVTDSLVAPPLAPMPPTNSAAELFKTVYDAPAHGFPPMLNTLIPGYTGGPVLITLNPAVPTSSYKPLRQKGLSPSAAPGFPLMLHPPKHSLRLVKGSASSWTVVAPVPLMPAAATNPLVQTATGLPPTVISSATSQQPMKLAAVLAAKQKPKIATTGMTPPTRRGRPPVKKGKGRGKGWRKGLGKKAESVQSGSSSATTTDAESFRSDADTGEGTSSGFSQQPDSVISSSVREDSVSGEADSGVGPLFTAAQKEAMADHYGDTGTALRYTALKEWCMSKGASLLHAGSVRNKFRALLQDGIDREEAGGIGVETVERVKEAMGRVRDPHLEEFKRQICLEIIRSRNPQYGVLRKEVERTKDPT